VARADHFRVALIQARQHASETAGRTVARDGESEAKLGGRRGERSRPFAKESGNGLLRVQHGRNERGSDDRAPEADSSDHVVLQGTD
jgi:hypothetical protein